MKKLLATKKFQSGFTLIELLIVVAIIVVLISIGAVSYTTVNRNARNAQRQSQLEKLVIGLEEYYADHHMYPDTLGTSSYWQEGGQAQGTDGGVNDCGTNPSYESFCCLFGDPYATNAKTQAIPGPVFPLCTAPYNTYVIYDLTNHQDPLYQGGSYIGDVRSFYKYASDGQTYVLVAPFYEGTAPSENHFSNTTAPYYWCEMIDWLGGTISFNNAYFVRSERQKTPSLTNTKNPARISSCPP